jgi:pimeloyl-ACP methyl ester carboxylesterase
MRVVFVHGAFVRDGLWWWAPAARLLSERGITSTAVRLPSCGEAGTRPTGAGPGLADDVAAVRSALDGDTSTATGTATGTAGSAGRDGGPEPAIVVAHSYGGMVVSEAAAGHPGVAALAYISSFLPEPGQSLADLGTSTNPVPTQQHADGSVSVIDEDLIPRFLHDVADPELVSGAKARLTPQSAAVFGTPVQAAAWRELPAWYLVCADDRSTAPARQREHAARADRVIELPAGHHPFLSRPDLVAAAIEQLSGG